MPTEADYEAFAKANDGLCLADTKAYFKAIRARWPDREDRIAYCAWSVKKHDEWYDSLFGKIPLVILSPP